MRIFTILPGIGHWNRMSRTRHIVAVILTVFAVGAAPGCASYPFGMSKQEWDSFPPSRQRALRNREDYEKQRDADETQRHIERVILAAQSGRLPW